ncbi:MAG: TauD/TfdA family dioxygenase [Pseudomonadota bacterium]
MHASLGVEVTDFDFERLDDPETAAALSHLLARHQVVLLRGQELSAEAFVSFCRAFGDLELLPEPEKRHPDYPEIARLTNVKPDGSLTVPDEPQAVFLRGTSRWHTDSSFRAIPCLATALYARQVTPEGGETEFANMVAAYESLDPAERSELEGLEAVHSYAFSRANNPGKVEPMSEEERRLVPDVTHPVVRFHADGRRSIYLGGHVSHLEGQDVDEGRARVRALEGRLTDVGNVYRHSWRERDLLIWDNRSTLHRLIPYDIARYPRSMWRCTVTGRDPVVGVQGKA